MVMYGFSTSMGLVKQVGRQRQRITVREERSSLIQILIKKKVKVESLILKKVKVKQHGRKLKGWQANEQREGGEEQPDAKFDFRESESG